MLSAVICSATMMVRGYSVKLQIKPLLPQYSCKYTEDYHRARQTQPILIFIIIIHFVLFPPQKGMFIGAYKQLDLWGSATDQQGPTLPSEPVLLPSCDALLKQVFRNEKGSIAPECLEASPSIDPGEKSFHSSDIFYKAAIDKSSHLEWRYRLGTFLFQFTCPI